MKTDNKARKALGQFAVCLFAFITQVHAGETDEMLEKLRAAYPGTRFDAVATTVVPGLFEVAMGRNIAYVESGGRYFFFGHLYDLPESRDLTALRKMEIDRVDVTAVPASDAVLISRTASPAYRVKLFSDPNCGYCRDLEQTLAELPQIEVEVHIVTLQPDPEGIARAIWCSPDRAKAWTAHMLGEAGAPGAPSPEVPAPSDCDTGALARNIALANQLGVYGTPTLIAEDGRIQPGATGRDALLAWLDRSTSYTSSRMESSR